MFTLEDVDRGGKKIKLIHVEKNEQCVGEGKLNERAEQKSKPEGIEHVFISTLNGR